MPTIKVERNYHPNGQMQWEGSFENGKLAGPNRHWHDNGILSRECSFQDGLEHGVTRQWDKEGKLLGEFQMDHGTGVDKSWFENGQLKSEVSWIQGKLCGRFRCWFEDGDLVSTSYYVRNKEVSKKKYDEACKTDATLPRYEEDGQKPKLKLPSTKYRKRKTPLPESERQRHDELIRKLRAQPNQAEARQWLSDNENRNIGEMEPEDSLEVIEEAYKAGAIKVIAVEISEESTNCLIVELPTELPKRRRVFEWSNKLAQDSGFDPDEDWGQGELFVFLT